MLYPLNRSGKHPGGDRSIKLCVLSFLLASVFLFFSNLQQAASEPIDSKSLKRTVITPHLETEIKPGENLVYCSTFQLAWNEFREHYATALPDAPEVVKILDKKMVTKNDITEDSYITAIGPLAPTIEKINKTLTAKFKAEAALLKRSDFPIFSDSALLAFACLYKKLKFKNEFESLDSPLHFFDLSTRKSYEVKSFGIEKFDPRNKKHQRLSKQVAILDYKNLSDFIIRLNSVSKNDDIILASVKPEKTLLQTIETVTQRIERSKVTFLDEDQGLMIPKFDLEIIHSFTDIASYLSHSAQGPAEARQDIRFRLDEKGAVVKSQARIAVEGIRTFLIFYRPFLIYLKQKDSKYPYLAIWVDNPELLLKY